MRRSLSPRISIPASPRHSQSASPALCQGLTFFLNLTFPCLNQIAVMHVLKSEVLNFRLSAKSMAKEAIAESQDIKEDYFQSIFIISTF